MAPELRARMSPMGRPEALVIEDSPEVARLMGAMLDKDGYNSRHAPDGARGMAMARAHRPELILLDLTLPDSDGVEVCRQLREITDAYIVMVTSRTDEVDKIVGLTVGADDYVTKPFSPRELVSRVKAILRRTGAPAEEKSVISVKDLSVDTQSRQVKLGEEPVHLTNSEYRILLHLARHPGTAFSREAILTSLWEESPVGDERAIDVHIHNMREKIESDPKNPTYLLTVRGFGYRLCEA
jgi:DNA-binding response OmpR family regulator